MITLKSLPQATAQEVFDYVVGHLRKQGQRAYDEGKGCRYRMEIAGGNALKCAAGCLIGDDEYSPVFEEKLWGSLVDKKLVPDVHVALIEQLQDVHDGYESHHWEAGFRQVAAQNNVIYTPAS